MKKMVASFLLLFCSFPIFAGDDTGFYQKLLAYAPKTVGLTEFPTVNNKKYNGDCSGFIAFLFHIAGLNLLQLYGKGDSGVSSIWDGLSDYGFILGHDDLVPGDIVFFDNTYDKNKNGLWDDKFSHIGVVEFIDANNTITYLHYGGKGVVRAKMNLYYPTKYAITENGQQYRVNDLLRNSSEKGVNPKYLASSLFRGAARIVVEKAS